MMILNSAYSTPATDALDGDAWQRRCRCSRQADPHARDLGRCHASQGDESALQESETRFGAMANSAPVMLWMSGVDKLYVFNQSWLDFTGRTQQQEMGNGWTDGVHRKTSCAA
jgi:PAS domain-containing protein